MKQAVRRQPIEITTIPPKKAQKVFRNIIFGVVVIIALLMTVSLLTYHPEDSAWSKTVATDQAKNWLGNRGAFFSDVVFTTIGQASWLIPILSIAYAYRLIYKEAYKGLDIETVMIRILGVILMLLAVAGLFNIYNPNSNIIDRGGAIGQFLGTLLTHSIGWLQALFPDSFISVIISKIILFFFLFITAIMASGCGPLAWIDALGALIIYGNKKIFGLFKKNNGEQTDHTELSDIQHLMEKEATEEPKEDKRSFLANLIKPKDKSTKVDVKKTIHPNTNPEELQAYFFDKQPEETSKPIEPTFEQPKSTKVEPSFASPVMTTAVPANNKSIPVEETAPETSSITPKFEPQLDEQGQPKLPSIFKRPTIKSEPQNNELSSDEMRLKNLSEWANEHEDLAIDQSHSYQEPVFTFSPSEKLEPISIIPSKSFEVEPAIEQQSSSSPVQTQSMFSQTNSYTTQKQTATAPAPIEAIPESEQDFNAFIETLEKYHTPDYAFETQSAPTLVQTPIVEPIIEPVIEPVHEMIQEYELPSFQQSSTPFDDLNLPQFSEFSQPTHETRVEPEFHDMNLPTFSTTAETTIEAIEPIATIEEQPVPSFTPTWEPFEPEMEVEEELEEEIEIIQPARIEPVEFIEPAKPIQNIVMPAVPRPAEMSENKKAELLKHFPMAGQLPPLNLLGDPPPTFNQYDIEELNDMAQLIEEQLKNFSIKVQVANIEPGPVVTRFELDLAPGVKVAQINNLEKDIARGLSVTSVRVVDIIPGTSYVGLEIPNRKREIVYFKSGLESKEYQEATDPLTLILGKSISGEPVLANLAKMPHVLVAGTTGSGKSVGVNTMLLSMLFKARPDELRLILIDPKMLELSVYNDIPHLLIPVITDMKESANALRWCVAEMERRYMLMSQLKVRNIAGFNQKVQEAIDAGQPIIDPLWRRSEHVSDTQNPPLLEKLPFIVVVIDEFADMMMLVGKKCEELIARLAQKARASGIHLILATQRPSVDVITGLIKANIPTRIAFQVSSKIDSRTIIDQQGAETLLGHGDMLYAPSGVNVPIRVHGAFVDDNEVNKVAEFLKLTGEPDYIEDILQEPTEAIPGLSPEASGVAATPSDDQDPLFDEAVKIVVESRRASISFIQRKLRVGYQRAARLMEEMEELRIVTPPQSNGNREVLMAAENDDY